MKKRILIVFIFSLCIIGMPQVANAKKTSSVSSKAGTACNYNVKISVGKYSLEAGYDRNTHEPYKTVKKRKITIKAKNGYYKIKTFDAEYGKLSKLKGEEDVDTSAINWNASTDPDNKYEIEVDAGHEMLVLVMLKGNNDGNTENNDNKTYANFNSISFANHSENVTKKVTDSWDASKACVVGSKSGNSQEDLSLNGTASSVFVENPDEASYVTNIKKYWGGSTNDYNDECKYAYEGKYVSKAGKIDNNLSVKQSDLGKWREFFQNSFDYCSQNSVDFILKDSTIRTIRNDLLSVFKEKNDLETKVASGEYIAFNVVDNEIKNLRADANWVEYKVDSTTKKVDAGENGIALQCSADETTKGEKKQFAVSKIDNKYCDIECYETLKVRYSPPVAVKSGLCFQYKVTVESETKCGVDIHTDELQNLVNTPTTCSPTPVCENDDSNTQAGPNDEFDQCIADCDNGEYSQSCINKCYKKIYSSSNNSNNETTKTNAVESNSNDIMKLSFSSKYNAKEDYYNETNKACSTDNLKNASSATIEKCAAYYQASKLLYPGGHYKYRSSCVGVEEGTDAYDENNCDKPISWHKDSSITDFDGVASDTPSNIAMNVGRAAPFYFRDIATATQTMYDLLGKSNGKNDKTDNHKRKYIFKDNGTKRQYNDQYQCPEKCGFSGCESTDIMSDKDYQDYYNNTKEIKKIISDLKECNSQAKCNSESQKAEFEISIDNKRKDKTTTVTNNASNNVAPSTGATTSSTEGNSTSTTVTTDGTTENGGSLTMFVPEDGDTSGKSILGYCYDRRTPSPHHKTTITFPGSWINLKTGSVTYFDKTTDKTYYAKDQYFCTAYDSEDVNADWWKWKMEGTGTAKANEYNINSSIKQFGKYYWDVSFSCFYGLYNKTGPSTEPSDENTKINNYSFKIINLQNAENNLKGKSGKLGYNWTSAAQIKNITNTSAEAQSYAINPEEYLSTLKNEKYDDNDKNSFDYYFELTDEDLSNIRNENKNRTYSSYNGFDDNAIKTVEGIPDLTVYKSDILTKLERNGSMKKRATAGINNS